MKLLNNTVQQVGWRAMLEPVEPNLAYKFFPLIQQEILEKRRLRKQWQRLKTDESKILLNATEDTDYSYEEPLKRLNRS